jgi:hypothetical protein
MQRRHPIQHSAIVYAIVNPRHESNESDLAPRPEGSPASPVVLAGVQCGGVCAMLRARGLACPLRRADPRM